jgi:hypothetical protein
VDARPGHARDQQVRDAARQEARRDPVLAVAPPAADDVEAVVELRDEPADVGGIVLQVAVHRHDRATAAARKPAAIAAVWP